eukprot:192113_1
MEPRSFTRHQPEPSAKRRKLNRDNPPVTNTNNNDDELVNSNRTIKLPLPWYHEYSRVQESVVDASTESVAVIKQKLLRKLEDLDTILSDSQNTIHNASSFATFTKISSNELSKIDHELSQLRMSTSSHPFKQETIESKRSIESHCRKQTQFCKQSVNEFNTKIRKYKKEITALQHKIVELENITQTVQSSCHHYTSCLNQYESVKDESIAKLDAHAAEVEKAYHSCIQKADHDERLRDIINKTRTHFETDYKQWNVDDILAWIKTIENAYFDKKEYGKFMNAIQEMQIDGTQLTEMNNKLFLNQNGLTREKDQYIVRKHINRIVKQKNDMEYRNVCGVCMTNVINTVMIPCGHCFSCWSCSEKHKIAKCPMCRKEVNQVIKTFLSGYSKIH